MKNKINPIFILGSARNGTIWLFNILCNHLQIVGLQHKVHWGIHESNTHKNIHYWRDISNINNFIRFFELYSSADYFKLSSCKKDFFYKNRPRDFLEFFFMTMDCCAQKNNADYWLTKIDPDFYLNPSEFDSFLKRIDKRYERAYLLE